MAKPQPLKEDFAGEYADVPGWERKTLLAPDDLESGTATAVIWTDKREGSPEVFAANLRMLTVLKGLKATTAAEAVQEMLLARGERELLMAGGETKRSLQKSIESIKGNPVDAKWYRRLMREGVSRTDERTIKHLGAIALFFDIKIEELWDEELKTRLNLVKATDKEVPRPSIHVLYAKKVESLLDSGEYDFLKPLIDSLDSEMRRKKKKK